MREPIQKFEFEEIEPGFYSIEQNYVRSFMIMDHKEILLIDLGMGGNHLLDQVRAISDLPIKVIFTHADGDHIGDAADFEQCYMHPSEYDYYKNKVKEPVDLKPIWEGDIIEIGKYRFEIILTPGHTPGSIGLLDRKEKIMIGGDTVQSGPIFMFGPGRNFKAYEASMKKLIIHLEDVEWIYACHHDKKVPVKILRQLLAGATKMLEGKVVGEPEERFEGKIKRYDIDGISFYAL